MTKIEVLEEYLGVVIYTRDRSIEEEKTTEMNDRIKILHEIIDIIKKSEA